MSTSIDLDDAAFDALLQRAAKAGAREALESIGLHDEKAGDDVRELRDLLRAWRGARSEVWRTAVRWVTTVILALLIAGAAIKAGMWPPQ